MKTLLVNKYLTEGKSSKFDIKGLIKTLNKVIEEMVNFNVSGSQDRNIQNVKKAISALEKIKMGGMNVYPKTMV